MSEIKETVYKIETIDKSEANLMLNAARMAGVLYNIIDWYKDIYNGRDYDSKIYSEKLGKIMSQSEYNKYKEDNNITYSLTSEDDLKVSSVYTSEQVEDKLNSLIEEVKDLIYNYYD